MNFPVFDLHCDTALALLDRGFRVDKQLKTNALHIDLDRASRLPGYCQCFACFTTPWQNLPEGVTVHDVFERELNAVLLQVEQNRDRIRQAFTPEEIRENLEKGMMSAVLTIEGPAGFGYEPDLLEMMYAVGFRASTLGWNEENVLIGSHATGGGLTAQGAEYVRECQRLGILVDVSHCSDQGFWDMLKITEAPLIATHSNSRAIHGHSRNLTDDMFRAICGTGGTVGINLYADFLGENATVDTVCDHIFHYLELDPQGEHISLGGDLDGCDVLPAGITGIESYPVLAQRLLERGAGEQIVANIYWNNAIGVMERAVRNHKK